MKIFLIVATLVQLTLLSFSKYYRPIANDVLRNAVETKEADLLSSLDKFDYYSDLDNDLFLAAVTVWVMVLVVTKLKSISSTDMANLAICLPLFFNMILMSI
ncbi:hypothetical protein [Vibrio parahaemolyticus]|uniref:hypothetical protein n=1 Tax=Vibrio parahaemolyticus TaxID=670 RepID=UPI00063ECEC1|nr:hypothetical protein [Vibrio parahaemolyticus]ELA9340191.1 hypothetical protein [Vibrio parahaemolyticus]KLI83208.1 hypothetical protein AAY62_20650 [Vibrio parahaemolyticus]MBE4048726.1 hypothetical protein [Vibrio parahaemolyticus]MCX8793795.1 hypothetical protein [Vibrio parahaemolyticus]